MEGGTAGGGVGAMACGVDRRGRETMTGGDDSNGGPEVVGAGLEGTIADGRRANEEVGAELGGGGGWEEGVGMGWLRCKGSGGGPEGDERSEGSEGGGGGAG